MMLTIVTMILTLVLPNSIAPRINGSKRFLFGSSFQPSELGKLGVIVWVSMLVVRKGDSLRRLTKGLVPFLVVIGLLDVLAALEPDLSVSMLYTLLMALLLFIGGARMSHFVALAALGIPLLWHKIEKVQYAVLRLTAFLDPGGAPSQVNYQLKQSLIAVGSGGLFGVGFGQGRQQYGFLIHPGTVGVNTAGTPGSGGSTSSRIRSPSDASAGRTGPGRATITTRTPEQGCSATNSTRFVRPPNGPTDSPVDTL